MDELEVIGHSLSFPKDNIRFKSISNFTKEEEVTEDNLFEEEEEEEENPNSK